MRRSALIIIVTAAVCLTAGELHAQQLASGQVGIARPVAVRTARSVTLAPMSRGRPRRWPYVVGGAVVGGVAGGLWLARQAAKTDDAVEVPVVAIGAVAGGAALGALGGLIVSVIVDPRYD